MLQSDPQLAEKSVPIFKSYASEEVNLIIPAPSLIQTVLPNPLLPTMSQTPTVSSVF